MEAPLAIETRNLRKVYGSGNTEVLAMRDVSIAVRRGEVVALLGPSGAGKSTFLTAVGLINPPTAGQIRIGGQWVLDGPRALVDLRAFRRQHIGFVFQLHNLLPEFTTLENVMIPLMIRRVSKRRARKAAARILERFDIASRAHHRPAELSGGECQRVAVARAIVGEPDILLADEPTGNLDRTNSRQLTDMLLELGREKGATIIIVTHDREIASRTERTITLVDGMIET